MPRGRIAIRGQFCTGGSRVCVRATGPRLWAAEDLPDGWNLPRSSSAPAPAQGGARRTSVKS
jgi:hypothetical protein